MTAPPRQGPRPLALHLTMSAAVWTSSLAALPLARNGSIGWSAEHADEAGRIANALAAADAERIAAAVASEARRRLAEFVAGIGAYRAHPYRRAREDPPPVWSEGSSRLLDFGGDGLPVLLVPSLVNRAYILDLAPGASFTDFMLANGVRPLLLDWGEPGEAERAFDLDAYVGARLAAALEAAHALAGGALPLVGYCMGGLLALAASLLKPGRVSRLALLATPWDFHAGPAAAAGLRGLGRAVLAGLPAPAPALPVDLIQALFAALQPHLIGAKFRRFARLDPASAEARSFVALEDWLNDGVCLAAPTARDCLIGWYERNLPGRGLWRIAGRAIRPEELEPPSFVALPRRDRIVPPRSAAALARALPRPRIVAPSGGHIGMMVGRRAETELWRPLLLWLTGG